MLNKKDIEKEISLQMLPVFQQADYNRMSTDPLHFQRQFESGFKSCIISVSEYKAEFWVELSIGIRFNIVENLANQFTLTLKDYHQHTHTILTSYGRMIGNQYFRFKVTDNTQVSDMCREMNHFLDTAGFTFLDQNSSIYQIDELINTYPERPSKFIYNQSNRCIKGLIIAKLCQNPHFNTLVKAYHFILEKHSLSDRMLPRYVKLVNHLNLISMN